MLAFKYRFHGHGGLRYVYKNGAAIRTHYMTVKYSRNDRRKIPRVAVVVSKKVLKSAVGRNRIRRRLYETIRCHEAFMTLNGCDIVFIVTSSEVRSIAPIDMTKLVDEMMQEITQTTR